VSALFTINFRRETYLKEVARARRRVIALGAWVAYFGVLGIVLGLYGLNCASLVRRAGVLERQAARMQGVDHKTEWKVPADEMARVDRYVANPARWRDRLVRLAQVMPTNARITSLAVNPDNMSGPDQENRLVISGEYRIAPGVDRMHGVVAIVDSLRRDTVFSRGYGSIRLVTTKISEQSGMVADFTIECR
jgi:hypothetical protein